MPYNHRKLELRLSACDKKLAALFAEKELGEKIKQQIKAVQNYYNLSYTKAVSAKTVEAIASSYESFIDNLTKVKNGEMSRQDAEDALLKTSESRKINVIYKNLAKACEFLFWSATTFSLYAGIFGLALPVLIIQPVLGAAVGITIIGAMLAAGYKALSCLTEFTSVRRHDKEYTNEMSLVSFFKPAPKKPEVRNPIQEDELENACCI